MRKYGAEVLLDTESVAVSYDQVDADFDYTTTGGGSETWTDTQLVLTRPNSAKMEYELSTNTENSGIIFAQCHLTWASDSANEDIAGMMITSSVAPVHGTRPNYSAAISSRAAAPGGKYRLKAMSTISTYDSNTAITKDKDIKITYDVAATEIKYWYRDGVSAWVQMGTTQTSDILQGGTLKLILRYDYIATTIGNVTFDKIYFGSVAADYTTQYPPDFSYTLPTLVEDYQHIMTTLSSSGNAAFTLKFLGSFQDTIPDFSADRSNTNRREYIQFRDYNTGDIIGGDTGIAFTNDDVVQQEINVNGLKRMGAEVSGHTAGTVSLRVQAFSNDVDDE